MAFQTGSRASSSKPLPMPFVPMIKPYSQRNIVRLAYLGVDGSEMWPKMLWGTYLQVRCSGDLGHTFKHFWDGDSGNEREEPETI